MWVRKKEVNNLQTNVKGSFEKMRQDLGVVYRWLTHVIKKNKDLEESHKQLSFTSEKDREKIISWINHFSEERDIIKGDIKKLSSYIVDMHGEFKHLYRKLEGLETASNFPKFEEEYDIPMESSVKFSDLTPSESTFVNLLMDSNDKLTYDQISERLGLNYGTVKNRLSAIRKKGIEINWDLNENSEKKFYLNDEERIKISGR
jgi:hypothetical protein